MMTVTQLEALRPALAAWNAANARARREYDAHPIAACAGMRHIDWRGVDLEFPCEEMATMADLCRRCHRDHIKALKEGQ